MWQAAGLVTLALLLPVPAFAQTDAAPDGAKRGTVRSDGPPAGPHRIDDLTLPTGQSLLVSLAGEVVDPPFRVRVSNARSGRAVGGLPVEFTLVRGPVADSQALFDPPTATTDDGGVAETRIRLGREPGQYVATAFVPNLADKQPLLVIEARDTSWLFFLFAGLCGGLSIFLFGIQLGSEGLEKIAGNRMRTVLGTLTNNRFLGVGTGALLTAMVQSSSATSVMLVGFTNVGLMTLPQTLGVLLGAGIGTTFTVQLIAFKVTDYAPLILAGGFLLRALSSIQRRRYLGQAIMGFGFVFFGMQVMASVMGPLRSYPGLGSALLALGDRPFTSILISTLLTALIHSSAGTMAILLTLASQGLLTLPVAVPLMLGANLGTCVNALMASVGTKKEAQRVGWAHVAFKVGGISLALLLLEPLTVAASHMASSVPRQIAWSHTIFNVCNAAFYLPFLTPFARLVEWLVPERKRPGEAFAAHYLLPELAATPDLALENCLRELLRMGGYGEQMIVDAMAMFRERSQDAIDRATAMDNQVDKLQQEIRRYMSLLAQRGLTDQQSRREMALLYLAEDLEHIGDVVENDLVPLAQKVLDRDLHFTEQGMAELEQFHATVLDTFRRLLTALRREDKALAEQILQERMRVNRLEKELRRSHLQRINQGIPESLESGTVHMDVLSGLKRINSYCNKSAMTIIEEF